jgi:hypothetical protein
MICVSCCVVHEKQNAESPPPAPFLSGMCLKRNKKGSAKGLAEPLYSPR